MATDMNQTNGLEQSFSQTCESGQVVADSKPAPFDFGATEFEIGINVRPFSDKPYHVFHRLRRPSLDELLEREQQIVSEIIEVSAREDSVVVDEEQANWRLWEKIVQAVKGYDFKDGVSPEEWRTPTEEQKARILWAHKLTAVRGIYASDCRIVDEGAFDFEVSRLRQDIGTKAEADFSVFYEMRIPTEGERQRFKQQASNTRYVRGARKSRARVVSNLRAFASFFDMLLLDLEGGTLNGQAFTNETRGAFLREIDPIWKRQVINTLIGQLESQLQD